VSEIVAKIEIINDSPWLRKAGVLIGRARDVQYPTFLFGWIIKHQIDPNKPMGFLQ